MKLFRSKQPHPETAIGVAIIAVLMALGALIAKLTGRLR